MDDTYRKFFQKLPRIEPSANLNTKILTRIKYSRVKSARLKLLSVGIFTFFFTLVTIPALRIIISDFSSSDFSQYVSLIFTDSNFIIYYWKEFVLSLLESLPVASTLIILAEIFAFITIINVTSKNLKFASLKNNTI